MNECRRLFNCTPSLYQVGGKLSEKSPFSPFNPMDVAPSVEKVTFSGPHDRVSSTTPSESTQISPPFLHDSRASGFAPVLLPPLLLNKFPDGASSATSSSRRRRQNSSSSSRVFESDPIRPLPSGRLGGFVVQRRPVPRWADTRRLRGPSPSAWLIYLRRRYLSDIEARRLLAAAPGRARPRRRARWIRGTRGRLDRLHRRLGLPTVRGPLARCSSGFLRFVRDRLGGGVCVQPGRLVRDPAASKQTSSDIDRAAPPKKRRNSPPRALGERSLGGGTYIGSSRQRCSARALRRHHDGGRSRHGCPAPRPSHCLDHRPDLWRLRRDHGAARFQGGAPGAPGRTSEEGYIGQTVSGW